MFSSLYSRRAVRCLIRSSSIVIYSNLYKSFPVIVRRNSEGLTSGSQIHNIVLGWGAVLFREPIIFTSARRIPSSTTIVWWAAGGMAVEAFTSESNKFLEPDVLTSEFLSVISNPTPQVPSHCGSEQRALCCMREKGGGEHSGWRSPCMFLGAHGHIHNKNTYVQNNV